MSTINGVASVPLILLLILTVTCITALVLSMHQNKFRLLNGILANFSVILLGITLMFLVELIDSQGLRVIFYVGVILILIPLAILYSLLGVLLLWNAWTVWRRESHTLGNMLTLFLGILIIVILPIIRSVDSKLLSNQAVGLYVTLVEPVILYLVFWFLAFITSFILTRLYRPKYNQEYIIVLGAGLLNGKEVSPLLASRIQIALDFANKQYAKTGHYPWLIFSGGQGGDEKLPEGVAMADYANHHGAQTNQVLIEDQSKTTYENMLFSKKILQEHGLNLAKGLFATSDYHTFRAAGYARLVGLQIDGLGAKTSRFFIPNAFIREYIALLANHKVFHAICLSIILLISIVSFIVGNGIFF
ncbi:MAG TPA: YdcF family protein [Weissella thailandensis]|uniref:YdcF family protein n=1 Tax=Weissella thailandensis TaxID=89061 RepID=UPI001D9556E8|nr:YdcF family protein [Weissella thailandensis]HJG84965.1 YdcF family protein [Weissella thailandensis]